MKKTVLFAMCAVAMTACNNGAKEREKAMEAERDSLMQVLDQRDAELDDIMGIVSEVQDGFRRINEAEGRITVENGNLESASVKQSICENMLYIQDAMAQNREKIRKLEEKLQASNVGGEKLRKMVEELSAQLEEQKLKVQELEAQLAEKNIVIAQQGETINSLNENVTALSEENKSQSETLSEQDKQLNSAWYVFGTKSELKEQKILSRGDVLKESDFNRDYFTKIDIRYDKEVKLYSKSATLLTSHPANSYKLEKDSKGQYVLEITDPTTFWSVSKYLVIQVK